MAALVHAGANKMVFIPPPIGGCGLEEKGGGGRGVECRRPPPCILRGKEAARGGSHWDGKTTGGGGEEGEGGLGYVELGPADPLREVREVMLLSW